MYLCPDIKNFTSVSKDFFSFQLLKVEWLPVIKPLIGRVVMVSTAVNAMFVVLTTRCKRKPEMLALLPLPLESPGLWPSSESSYQSRKTLVFFFFFLLLYKCDILKDNHRTSG